MVEIDQERLIWLNFALRLSTSLNHHASVQTDPEAVKMKRVVGIGGIFLRARNPKRLAEWYRKRLGIPVKDNVAVFAWRGLTGRRRKGHTIWALFSSNSEYFGRRKQQVMVNYRVDNLRSTLDRLRREGVKVEAKVDELTYGKFGWVFDPEGNKIELWEPPRNYHTPEKQFPAE